jgi:pyruvate/2-oxoglutarate dehydrogenase complex dihydrolipoamide acyltransferase (E2) component
VAEIPSPFHGKIHKMLYDINETCLVGKTLCELMVEDDSTISGDQPTIEHHITEREDFIPENSKSMFSLLSLSYTSS